jgi:gliding motility-associated-like protein
MDTYTNSLNPAWDPVGSPADHLAILSNGSPSHQAATALAGPVAAIPPNANIEDGQYHDLRVTWDASTGLMEVYFDCLLRLEAVVDVPLLLNNENAIYGFTASTGGLSNSHRICDVEWNPFTPDVLPDELALCPGVEVTWSLPPGSMDAEWSPAIGLSSTTANTVTLTAEEETTYTVSWVDPCGEAMMDEVALSLIDSEDVFESFEACPGDVVELSPAVGSASVTWWDGSDDLVLEITDSGSFTATVDASGCIYEWTAAVSFSGVYTPDLGPDATLCLGETVDLNALDPEWDGEEPVFSWNGLPGVGVLYGAGPGAYDVLVVVEGCSFSDELNLTASENVGVSLGSDVELCSYEEVEWASGYDETETTWTGLQGGEWVSLGQAEAISWDGEEAAAWGALAVSVAIGECVAQDTVAIETVDAYHAELPEEVHFCEGSSVMLVAAPGADSYSWAGGPATSSWDMDDPGIAELTATIGGCTWSENVVVIEDLLPAVDCGPDLFVCEGTQVVLNAGVFAADEFIWSGPSGPGSGPQFEATTGGAYSVTVVEGDCQASDGVAVTIQELPLFELGADRLGCSGVSEELVATGLPSEANITWGHGPEVSSVLVNESGVYTAYSEWNGCFHYDAVQVTFASPLQLDLPLTVKKCPEDTVRLSIELPEDIFEILYDWSSGESVPHVQLFDHGDYSVTVSNACESLTAYVALELESCACEVYIPTAFTPDNDGVNDAFRPEFNCPLLEYDFQIYDRWGELVFASQDPASFWYGQVAEAGGDEAPYFALNGLYFWKLELNYFQRGEAHATKHSGHVLLVR